MALIRVLSMLLTCLMLPGLVQAETLPVPSVDFSADRLIETEEGTFSIRVYGSGGKERSEMEMAGMGIVNIIRPDKNVAWMLMPIYRMYQEVQMGQAQAAHGSALLPSDMKISKVGQEKIDGRDTTKYKMTMADHSVTGFIWVTAEGITVKMDALSEEGADKRRVKMSMSNLKIGKQDPALFELPSGYEKMSMPDGMGGGMSGMQER